MNEFKTIEEANNEILYQIFLNLQSINERLESLFRHCNENMDKQKVEKRADFRE